MARKAAGQIIERDSVDGRTYAIRFRAYGGRHYLTLGSSAEGWTRRRAEEELQNILADVRRGIWIPEPDPEPVAPPPSMPNFHQFASEWYAGLEVEGYAENTLSDYKWQLSNHLLPFFAEHRLTETLPAGKGEGGHPLGRVDQQDDHPARTDPRDRG